MHLPGPSAVCVSLAHVVIGAVAEVDPARCRQPPAVHMFRVAPCLPPENATLQGL